MKIQPTSSTTAPTIPQIPTPTRFPTSLMEVFIVNFASSSSRQRRTPTITNTLKIHVILHLQSLDGFPLFGTGNHSAWPIILVNLNLPPDIRTHLTHILCYGIIPAPRAVKDMDSFFYPLHQELVKLVAGISTLDLQKNELCLLHMFLILIFGDMPAIAKTMRMKAISSSCVSTMTWSVQMLRR